MRIFHVSTEANLSEIRKSGLIKAMPQLVPYFDEYGDQDWEWQNRAYFCLSHDCAMIAKSALENHYNVKYEIGEFQADDSLVHYPDPNFTGIGYYSKKDIKIRS